MKRVLIIEDNDALREEVVDWFTFEGFDIDSANNGKDGIRLALANNPDLILCDIMMPEMDGHQVLEELRNRSETQLTPFIYMTALSERKNIRSGMEQGADDYITKPFTREELLSAVNTRLNKSGCITEQTDQALGELRNSLILNLPHELRTPLNGILGFGQMLRDNSDSFDASEITDIGNHIYNSANRLYHLIRNYLLFAQLELKKMPVPEYCEQENPDWICEDVAKKTANHYKRPDDLVLDLQKGIACITEPELIKILEELIDNAFKFSMKGEKVRVSCYPSDGKIKFKIEDSGRGITAENLKKIGALVQFDRKIYEQQGSGLGLTICRKLVDLFRGNMEIESTVDAGTKVTFELPGRVAG